MFEMIEAMNQVRNAGTASEHQPKSERNKNDRALLLVMENQQDEIRHHHPQGHHERGSHVTEIERGHPGQRKAQRRGSFPPRNWFETKHQAQHCRDHGRPDHQVRDGQGPLWRHAVRKAGRVGRGEGRRNELGDGHHPDGRGTQGVVRIHEDGDPDGPLPGVEQEPRGFDPAQGRDGRDLTERQGGRR
jgi:hypothetical protein